jgi:hypothetical protein
MCVCVGTVLCVRVCVVTVLCVCVCVRPLSSVELCDVLSAVCMVPYGLSFVNPPGVVARRKAERRCTRVCFP